MVEGLIVSYAELSLSGNHARRFMFQQPVRICNNEHGVVKKQLRFRKEGMCSISWSILNDINSFSFRHFVCMVIRKH
jgi:hypothetical protein